MFLRKDFCVSPCIFCLFFFFPISMTSFAIWQDEMKKKYAEAVKRGKG